MDVVEAHEPGTAATWHRSWCVCRPYGKSACEPVRMGHVCTRLYLEAVANHGQGSLNLSGRGRGAWLHYS